VAEKDGLKKPKVPEYRKITRNENFEKSEIV